MEKLKCRVLGTALALISALSLPASQANACTYIRLTDTEGNFYPGRTMEWGTFDLKPELAFVPRGLAFSAAKMPDGKDGVQWTAKFGFTAVTLLDAPFWADVINEEGLTGHGLYLPGFAEYQAYDPAQAAKSMSPTDVLSYMAAQFSTVAEVKAALEDIRVVPVVVPQVGTPVPIHYAFTDLSGAEMVVEFVDGELNIYDKTVSVMTNSPPYDWHLTNLSNYLDLQAVSWNPKSFDDVNFKPIGVGTGMLGLPGDFTPPSRFVRAMALSKTARSSQPGYDTTLSHFQIFNSFDVPLSVDLDAPRPAGMDPLCCSSTQYTLSLDPKGQRLHYRTDDNPTIRTVDLSKIDYGSFSDVTSQSMRTGTGPDTATDVTPSF